MKQLNDKAGAWFADNAKRQKRVKDDLRALTER